VDWKLVALLVIAAACDILTTEFALRYRKVKELNPLMRRKPVRIALKAAATAIVLIVAKYTHPATIIVASVVWLGAAIWNVTQISRKW
jgi:hypothetical protein